MKKLIFAGIAVLFALALITCNDDDGQIWDDLLSNSLPKTITVALCNCEEKVCICVPPARALTHDEAMLGYNYLEAVFVASDGTSLQVARSEWERGAGSAIRGVYRGSTPSVGIDYSEVTAPTTADEGAAIIFIGNRQKTLLAVGRLTETFENGVGVGSTYITENTTAVEFTVVALSGGLAPNLEDLDDPLSPGGTLDYTATSFLTTKSVSSFTLTATQIDASTTSAAPGTSFKPDYDINGAKYPLYLLAAEAKDGATAADTNYYQAKYTIYTADSLTGRLAPAEPIHGINAYRPAIQVINNITNDGATKTKVDFITAQAQVGNTIVTHTNAFPAGYDRSKLVVFANNTPDDPANVGDDPEFVNFDPVLMFNMTVPPMQGFATISFNFSIPVVALTNEPTTLGGDPIIWKIQAGTGTAQNYLDNGKGGSGGSILLGIGDASAIDIIVTQK